MCYAQSTANIRAAAVLVALDLFDYNAWKKNLGVKAKQVYSNQRCGSSYVVVSCTMRNAIHQRVQ